MERVDVIEKELRQFIAANLPLPKEVDLSEDQSFVARGILDSTAVVELILHVSQRYEVNIPMEDVVPENFDSIQRLAVYLQRRLGDRPHGLSESGHQDKL